MKPCTVCLSLTWRASRFAPECRSHQLPEARPQQAPFFQEASLRQHGHVSQAPPTF